ncbi:hypothetical protein L0F63_001829 [Massospora cicadina]|nr:hypothetical protein L0F63_001829 [Massospora cicadina]
MSTSVSVFCIDRVLSQLDMCAKSNCDSLQLQLLKKTVANLTKDSRPNTNPDFVKLLEKADRLQFTPYVRLEKRPKAMYVDRKTFSPTSMSRLLGMFAAQPKSPKLFVEPQIQADQLCAWLLCHQSGSRLLSRKPWKKRYFVLGSSSLVMLDSDHPTATPLDLIPLSSKSIVCQIPFMGFPTIAIQSPNHPIVHLRAESSTLQTHYVEVLSNAILAKSLAKKLTVIHARSYNPLSAI